MNDQIAWYVELEVKPGQLDALCTLTSAMVQSTKSESGALIYERFLSEDRQVVYVCERYVDSPAAVTHLQAFETMYGERFASLVDRKRFIVCGTPSHELRQILDRFGAVYFPRLAGFSRVQERQDGM
ncbi:MAG: putative quinol monooxygenase [Candidatus Entotheonellia bacterium]